MTKLTGKVLWFDRRDGYGIIKVENTEYYTSIDCTYSEIKSGDSVEFKPEIVSNVRCAFAVKQI